MAILTLSGSNTRRCETTVVAIDGSCLTCGAGAGQSCGAGVPRMRRRLAERRRRLAQLDRLGMDPSADPLAQFENAAWWS